MKISELVLAQSQVLWRFHLQMFSVCVNAEVVRCVSETNMKICYVNVQSKVCKVSESLFAKFASLPLRNPPCQVDLKLVLSFRPSSYTCDASEEDLYTFFKHFWSFAFIT